MRLRAHAVEMIYAPRLVPDPRPDAPKLGDLGHIQLTGHRFPRPEGVARERAPRLSDRRAAAQDTLAQHIGKIAQRIEHSLSVRQGDYLQLCTIVKHAQTVGAAYGPAYQRALRAIALTESLRKTASAQAALAGRC